MSSWRDQVLQEFTPQVARLTLVADPDSLLLEEGILEGIRDRGFDLIPFDDHVAFRYAYESKFRSRWDLGEHTDLVVVLRSDSNDLNRLPYDLLQAGRKLSFNLGDIFPKLSYPVVAALDRSDLEPLFEAQKQHAPGQLGDNSTKEFVLRHVFEIAPELVKHATDLLRVLLRRHYRGQRIPKILDDRLIHLLQQSGRFTDWHLEDLLRDREVFFRFLQERWSVFVDRQAAQSRFALRESQPPYGTFLAGPIDLPFDHHNVRVYIDNLFLEGFLSPVPHEEPETFENTWISVGIRMDKIGERLRRLVKLIENLESAIPNADARYGAWLQFVRGWSELLVAINDQQESVSDEIGVRFENLRNEVDDRFTAWLVRRFGGLINLPPVPPVMVHHLPRYLSRQIEDTGGKVALIVIDGLASDQWLTVRNTIRVQQPEFRFREQAIFAWVPSVTAVSRQATFAGKPPVFFPNSVFTTEKEPNQWAQFWTDHGHVANEMIFIKGLGDGNPAALSERLSHPKLRIAALVIDKVDRIVHGMELGSAGMHNQVRQWAEQGYLRSLLDLLLNAGFQVYLTSDHGNIEATGYGSPAEGSIADSKGQRVRVYPDATLRKTVKASFPEASEWDPVGLPQGFFPLIAPHRKAFVSKKENAVCHGGYAIEEIIVPFVRVERRGS